MTASSTELPDTQSTSDLTTARPLPAEFAHLKPTNASGAIHFAWAVGLTAVAATLSFSNQIGYWLVGQLLLAIAYVTWFCVLHEAGHKTLFRSSWLNWATGELAGVLALIPFHCWKFVHARHHYWAGWLDLDPTTSSLLPRRLSWFEKVGMNICWWLWIPIFSVVYRVQNYWHFVRLWRMFPRREHRWRMTMSITICLVSYAALWAILGTTRLLSLIGISLYVSFMFQDLLILSQHSHIPMPVSGGEPVRPRPPVEQEIYTRSLVFPQWFSRLVLLNIDAHELHHMYPRVPGYWLHTVMYRPQNATQWWQWVWRAKQIRGDVLLFQNRNDTGYDL